MTVAHRGAGARAGHSGGYGGTSVAVDSGMTLHPSPVVVGYDFSRSSHAALHRAVTLAACAPFHVLHVVCVIDPKEAIPSIPPYNGIDYMYAARVQEALAAEIQHELDGADVQDRVHFFVHARIGYAAPEILALASEVGADLIVVGSRGVTGLERLLVGSTAEHVVRDARCTVEVARSKKYPDVKRRPVDRTAPFAHVDPDARHPAHVAPHRYTYEDHRVNLRPADWPL